LVPAQVLNMELGEAHEVRPVGAVSAVRPQPSWVVEGDSLHAAAVAGGPDALSPHAVTGLENLIPDAGIDAENNDLRLDVLAAEIADKRIGTAQTSVDSHG
jgi:hypothetical protein